MLVEDSQRRYAVWVVCCGLWVVGCCFRGQSQRKLQDDAKHLKEEADSAKADASVADTPESSGVGAGAGAGAGAGDGVGASSGSSADGLGVEDITWKSAEERLMKKTQESDTGETTKTQGQQKKKKSKQKKAGERPLLQPLSDRAEAGLVTREAVAHAVLNMAGHKNAIGKLVQVCVCVCVCVDAMRA